MASTDAGHFDSPSSDQLALFPLEVGVVVRVAGVRGRFTVVGHGLDGSVQVYGGGKQQFRSFPADRVMAVASKVSARERSRVKFGN